ncbi:hypothetical protein [Streptomyces sp. SPB162]|uniref:hypothetical protein n=1 Tax=Streptomyces sp. SPB162 TaxID=2940560 RepID=UPI002407621D|nr:hypothetical protein [Streptomyces sp. SPB162]MDF9816766.1 NADP-dependent 3-hydroxy acid dehydrogenase YdfG [Streptomyces sp. SPB162]
MTQADAAAHIAPGITGRFGRLVILVNAANVMLNADSLRAWIDDRDPVVDVNLEGLMYINTAALTADGECDSSRPTERARSSSWPMRRTRCGTG